MGAQQAKEGRAGSGKDKHGHKVKPPPIPVVPITAKEALRPGQGLNIFTEHSGK